MCRELEKTWHREIPLTSSMGIRVVGLVNQKLHVKAGFDRNRNLHGTAFAGSLYSICVLTGWGAAWIALQMAGVSASIVAQTANIRYLRPVSGELRSVCALPELVATGQLDELTGSGRCRLKLACEVPADTGPAALFRGVYALRVKK